MSKTLSFTAPNDLRLAIKAAAHARETTMSEYMRDILRRAVQRHMAAMHGWDGDMVVALRKHVVKSQVDFARLAGLDHRRIVSRIESGDRRATNDEALKLERIAQRYGFYESHWYNELVDAAEEK